MTNSKIIMNALKARGMTDEQLSRLLDAYHGDLPFHTIPEWSRRGYHVKADASPLFDCYLWKHTSKPIRAAIESATEAGEDVPEKSPHFYKHLSHIYSFSQVEKNAPAPDLATIKARFGSLPGLVLKVKGEKTGAPNVWFTGDVEKYADEIKAAGGIWSKKKAAYWVKPSAAPSPSIMEDAPTAQPQDDTPTEPAPTAAGSDGMQQLLTAYRTGKLPVPIAYKYDIYDISKNGFNGFRSVSEYEGECRRLGYSPRRIPYQRNGEKFSLLITSTPGHPTGSSIEGWNLFTADDMTHILSGIISGGNFFHAEANKYGPGYMQYGVDVNYHGKLAFFGFFPDVRPAGYEDFDVDENGQVILPF